MPVPRKSAVSVLTPRRPGRSGHPRLPQRRCSQRRWLEISLIDLLIYWNEAPQAARARSCFVPRLATCSNRQCPAPPRAANPGRV